MMIRGNGELGMRKHRTMGHSGRHNADKQTTARLVNAEHDERIRLRSRRAQWAASVRELFHPSKRRGV